MSTLGERVVALEGVVNRLDKRLENVEKNAEATNKLATSVELLTQSIDNQGKSIEKIEKKIDNIQGEPKRKWDIIWEIAAGLILGYLFSLLTRGGF